MRAQLLHTTILPYKGKLPYDRLASGTPRRASHAGVSARQRAFHANPGHCCSAALHRARHHGRRSGWLPGVHLCEWAAKLPRGLLPLGQDRRRTEFVDSSEEIGAQSARIYAEGLVSR